MLQRGVKLVLLRNLLSDLVELKRRDIDSGQFLNGVHTTDSATDWKEFDRERDAYSGKACCLHTGVSFVETMIDAGLTHDPATGMPYFSDINTFVSYSWRGSGASLANLIVSVDDTLTTKGHEVSIFRTSNLNLSVMLLYLKFVTEMIANGYVIFLLLTSLRRRIVRYFLTCLPARSTEAIGLTGAAQMR